MSDRRSTTTPSSPSREAKGAYALARSEVYLFLARAFLYPQEPLDELYERAMAALHTLEAEGPPLLPPLPGGEALKRAYVGAFGHTMPVDYPPYETEYERTHVFGQTQAMVELAAFYRAFGLEPAQGERLDHIGTELEFLYYLTYKEAYAFAAGAAARAKVCRQGQRLFLERHLGRWAPLFLGRVAAKAPAPYSGLASFAQWWLEREARATRARPAVIAEEALEVSRRWGPFSPRLEEPAAPCEATL